VVTTGFCRIFLGKRGRTTNYGQGNCPYSYISKNNGGLRSRGVRGEREYPSPPIYYSILFPAEK
jgi:hypothetical protein